MKATSELHCYCLWNNWNGLCRPFERQIGTKKKTVQSSKCQGKCRYNELQPIEIWSIDCVRNGWKDEVMKVIERRLNWQ